MTVYSKMKAICDNIRLRTGGTALLNLDEIAAAILTIGGNVNIADWVHNAIGTTFPPAQLPADNAISGYDIDIMDATADDVYAYIDEVANSYPDYSIKETLGKDASGKYDMVRYMLANRQYFAWCKQNYPKMYAWKDNSESEVVPAFTNLKDQCTYQYGQRYSKSGGGFKTISSCSCLIVPVPSGSTSVVVRLKGVTQHTSYTAVYGGTSASAFSDECTPQEATDGSYYWTKDSDGVYKLTCPKSSTTTYILFHLAASGATDFTNAIITVNEPIEYTTVGGGTVYSTSVSPRIGEKMYDVPYVQDKGTQTVAVPAKAAVYVGYRYSHSGGAFSAQSGISSVILPLPKDGITSAVITLDGMTGSSSYGSCYGGTTNALFPTNLQSTTPWSNSYKTLTVPNGDLSLDGINYIVFFITSTGADGQYDGATITLNGEQVAWEIGNPSIATQESSTVIETEIGGTPVTAVSATNRSRTVGGVEYVRYEDGDIEPTVIYTNKGDERNREKTIMQNGITYNRYPLGDLGTDRTKLTPIFIYANEHGVELAGLDETNTRYQKYETKMCALIAARLVRDLCSGANVGNAFYKYIREQCMLIVIPVANPFGYNMNVTGAVNSNSNGYYNSNLCNINRNYDTPGWQVMLDNGEWAVSMGAYAGSENETQYIMNTMVESGAVVAMSLHGLGAWEGYCAHQGQDPDGTDYNQEKLAKVVSFLKDNYGYTLRYYDASPCQNMPDVTSKSPSYITQCGAYGGIVEFSPDDVNTSGWAQEMKSNVIENAYA